MIIRSRAPLRLGFGGGGTDISSFCDAHGGYVINAAIDKYAYATIQITNNKQINFVATDQKKSYSYDYEASLPLNGELDLHKATYNRCIQEFNNGNPISLTLTTYADVPPGSGLGSSSTLVVAMVKAFVELLNVPLSEYEIAHLAYEIERHDAGLNGGKQDQYAAAFGGFNFIEFYANNRVVVNPLRIKNWILCELEASLLLFYTGISRTSATIIDEQTKNIKNHDEQSINAMHSLKQDAVAMKESILKGDFKTFGQSLDASWQSKKSTAHNVTNDNIDMIYDAAKLAGAKAGKISGAGGGGFMMLYVEPLKRTEVINTLNQFSGIVSNCHFTKHGCQAWRV